MIARLLVAVVRAYQRFLSPMLGHNCRFVPTCSEYAAQALQTHGALKGTLLTVWRLLRCNPLGKYGYDPVPEKGQWKNPNKRVQREK